METPPNTKSCNVGRICHYTIEGNPIPLARPRFGQNYNKTRIWDSQKQSKFGVGIQVSNQHGDNPHLSPPIRLDVVFYLPIPKQQPLLSGNYHHAKIDLDNLLKFLLDSCNTIAYKDDAHISEIHARKLYAVNPRTEFTLTELK
jgi:Holliday junction resolvase RusA-like endonuclease